MPKILVGILLYVLEKILSFAFKKVLIGAGLGLATFALSQSLFSMFLSYVTDRFNELSALFWLVDLAGIDIALSYIISAVSIRLALGSSKLALRKI